MTTPPDICEPGRNSLDDKEHVVPVPDPEPVSDPLAGRPHPTLVAVLPELHRHLEAMRDLLDPAMGAEYTAATHHGSADPHTRALWQFLRGIGFALQGAVKAEAGDTAIGADESADAYLRGADDAAADAVGHLRNARAALAGRGGTAALAAAETRNAQVSFEMGHTTVERLGARVFAYDEDSDALTQDDLVVDYTAARSDHAIGWSGSGGPLALDGRALLDLTAAARLLSGAYDRYLHGTWPQAALGLPASTDPGNGP
jgi:hypothetical protein